MKIIHEITKNQKVSRKQLAETLNIGSETVKEYLEKLKRKGVLIRKGRTSRGYWKIIKR